jgi:hypothetical protein
MRNNHKIALGDPGTVDWLISLMQQPDQARAAGEAFSKITGCDIAYEDLETDVPEDFQAGRAHRKSG